MVVMGNLPRRMIVSSGLDGLGRGGMVDVYGVVG